MNCYKIANEIGDGGFGTVYLAIHTITGHKVAIKKMKKKFHSWDEAVNLPEVMSLKKLVHPNIIRLREVIRENLILYFVFEYLEENLLQVMKSKKDQGGSFTEPEIRWIMFQLFIGIAYTHKSGYFHRDLKLENILLTTNTSNDPSNERDTLYVTKIADFGLARELRSRPPYTEYISTRWYRAPEVVLSAKSYSSPIDMWAAGCIMAELYMLNPLFPGSSEIDQLFQIAKVLGSPRTWPLGLKLMSARNIKLPSNLLPTQLSTLIPTASTDAINLISSLLQYDPLARPSAVSLLNHQYFMNCSDYRSIQLNQYFQIVAGYITLNGLRMDVTQTIPDPGIANHPLKCKNPELNSTASLVKSKHSVYSKAPSPIPGVYGTAAPLHHFHHKPHVSATVPISPRVNHRPPSHSGLDELLADLDSLTNDVPQYLQPETHLLALNPTLAAQAPNGFCFSPSPEENERIMNSHIQPDKLGSELSPYYDLSPSLPTPPISSISSFNPLLLSSPLRAVSKPQHAANNISIGTASIHLQPDFKMDQPPQHPHAHYHLPPLHAKTTTAQTTSPSIPTRSKPEFGDVQHQDLIVVSSTNANASVKPVVFQTSPLRNSKYLQPMSSVAAAVSNIRRFWNKPTPVNP